MTAASHARTKTYQSEEQFEVEQAFIAACAAMGGMNTAEGHEVDQSATEGLCDLARYLSEQLWALGDRVDLNQAKGVSPDSTVGIRLYEGPDPCTRAAVHRHLEPYRLALVTHLDLATVNRLTERIGDYELFVDRWTSSHDWPRPSKLGGVWMHRAALLGLLRMFEPLVRELAEGPDFNWHDPNDPHCCAGRCPEMDDSLHPNAMLDAVRVMVTTVERAMVAFEVMES